MFESTTSQPVMNLKSNLANTAAALTAASISEVFPGAEMLGGGETRTGFFYEFFYTRPLPPEALSMLQENMRQIIRENRTVREMETVAISASVLFKRCDNKRALETVLEIAPKDYVSVIQIGEFYDLMEGPFCPSIRDVGAFQIYSMEFLEDKVIRLEGAVFSKKEELKGFLKLLANYKKANHLVLGQSANFWVANEGSVLWKSVGLDARKSVMIFLQKQFPGETLVGSESSLDAYALKRKFPFIATSVKETIADSEGDEGLFEEPCQSEFQLIIYAEEKDSAANAISLLQSVEKTLIILGFHAQLCLHGRRKDEKLLKILRAATKPDEKMVSDEWTGLSWIIKDALGREHEIFRIKAEAKEKAIKLQLKVGVEKILALLLELHCRWPKELL